MNIDLILMNEKMDNEFTSPVYGVKAVPVERIRANSYNPNVTAPPEMRQRRQKPQGRPREEKCKYPTHLHFPFP